MPKKIIRVSTEVNKVMKNLVDFCKKNKLKYQFNILITNKNGCIRDKSVFIN